MNFSFRFKVCFFIIIFFGCHQKRSYKVERFASSNYELKSLARQKIPESSKYLYKYAAEGKITGSYIYGLAIFDSTEIMTMLKINEYLPFRYLAELPNKDTIKGINFRDPYKLKKYERKEKELFENNSGFVISTKIYSNPGSKHYPYYDFDFESFKESKDSLYLIGVSSRRKPSQVKSMMVFKKGNIELRGENRLSMIHISERIEEIGTFYYFPKGDYDQGENVKNVLIYNHKSYYFMPKTKIMIDSFSDYGYFKEIR